MLVIFNTIFDVWSSFFFPRSTWTLPETRNKAEEQTKFNYQAIKLFQGTFFGKLSTLTRSSEIKWFNNMEPYWSFGDTIPVPTVARVHFLSPKLFDNTITSFGCHAFLLANFWHLHAAIFEDNFRPHPKVRLTTSQKCRPTHFWVCRLLELYLLK